MRDYYGEPRPDIQELVIATGRRILDVGCGAGALAAALRTAGAAYVAGVEASPVAAERARGRLDLLVEGSILEVELPFRNGEFDYLIFADVLEHLVDPDAALRRCLPYLASTGRVIVSVPNMRFYLMLLRLLFDRWSYTDAGIRDRTHLRIFTKRTLTSMLASHGLEIERLTRNYRLLDDQSEIGLVGALATRAITATLAPLLLRNLLAYQYVVVARPASGFAETAR